MDDRFTVSAHIVSDYGSMTSHQTDSNTYSTAQIDSNTYSPAIGRISFGGETIKIRDAQERLEELTSLLFSLLGVNIYDSDGYIRDISEIEQDIRSKNPKIIMTFEELMRFE